MEQVFTAAVSVT